MKNLKKILKGLVLLSIFLIPLAAFAQQDTQTGMLSIRTLFPMTGPGGATSVTGFIAAIIRILLFLAGAVAVLFVIIGGYYWMTAQGNDEQAEKGRKTLTNAIIGIVVVIMAYVIINAIVNLVSGPTIFGII